MSQIDICWHVIEIKTFRYMYILRYIFTGISDTMNRKGSS